MSVVRKNMKTGLIAFLVAAVLLTCAGGVYAWNWLGYKPTGLDDTVTDRGFVFGICYPQVGSPENYGHNLAGNHIFSQMADPGFDEAKMKEDIYNIKAFGFDAVSIPLFSLMEGVRFDEDGGITGLDEEFSANLVKLMDELIGNDLQVSVILQPSLHDLAYGRNGSGKATWDTFSQMFYRDTVRESYLDVCIKPVLTILKNYREHLLQIVLVAEPERNIHRVEGTYGTTWAKMTDFVQELNRTVHSLLPDVATTVETAAEYAEKFNDCGLTAIGVAAASDKGKVGEPADLHSTYPAYISQYCTEKSGASEDFIDQQNRKMLIEAADSGYIGAFFKEWHGTEDGQSLFIPGTDSMYRKWATSLYFNMYTYRQDRAGKEEDNAPVMLYNRKDGYVSWIGSRSATTYVVERSVDDGQTWAAATEELPFDRVDNGYFLCTWQDTEGTDNARYRVIADKGTNFELTSLPSN